MGTRFGSLDSQYFDNAGAPLVDGKIAFKESGTNDDKTTFSDIDLTPALANDNPVILSGSGVPPPIFFDGTAKAILFSKNDVQIRVMDPVSGSGSATSSRSFPLWDALTTYSSGQVVAASNGFNYKCIVVTSQGQDPTSVATDWSKVRFVGDWNINETYALDDIVQASDKYLYINISAGSGDNPITVRSSWKALYSQIYSASTSYEIGEVVQDSTGFLWRSLTDPNLGNIPGSSPSNWAPAVSGAVAAIEWISAQTASNDATIDFTLPGGFDEYELRMLNIVAQTDASPLWARTSTDGGSVFDSGASDYIWSVLSAAESTASVSSSVADAQIVLSGGIGDSVSQAFSGVLRIVRPAEATETTIYGTAGYANASVTPKATFGGSMGQRQSAADVDAIQFLFASGLVVSGDFALYGVNRS